MQTGLYQRVRADSTSGDQKPMRSLARWLPPKAWWRWTASFGLPGPALLCLGLLCTGLATSAAASAPSDVTPAHQTGVELTAATQRTLKQLADGSIQWHKAFLQESREAADGEVQTLLANTGKLGFERLPDLNLAALARAVEAAQAGDFARASWALAAAEELDPGRPETTFAQATVNRLQGRYASAFTDSLRGYVRLFSLPVDRSLWVANVILWCLYALLAAGGFLVLLLIGVRGRDVALDLADSMPAALPRWLGWVVVVALLLAPLVLPDGLIWFLLVWTVLLWAYCSVSERVVLALVLLLAGVVPFLVSWQRERVTLALSPPVRAINALAEGRLYGRLFTDLGVLRSVLPNSPVVHQVVGDLHRTLGQWELARSTYLDLLEVEPGNASVLIDLGVYFYRQDDYGRAATYFKQATQADPENALAFFDLSQAFSSAYLFDESQQALQQAQQIQGEDVGRWIQEATTIEVRPVEGGVARLREVERELLLLGGGESVEGGLPTMRRSLPLLFAIGVILMASALHFARRSGGLTSPDRGPSGDGAGDLLLRVLVPGLPSVREGAGITAYLALVPLVALLLLPFSETWGFSIPWGFDPGDSLAKLLTTLGLVVYLLLRLMQQRRAEG